MRLTEPKITVLMPAYNAAKYIAAAIASVLDQSFTEFELLIINDGSTDDTEMVIRSFEDERIRLINQSNLGVAAALNLGLMNANADLVARFDADDICFPSRLEVQYNMMMSHPEYILIGSDAEYINSNGEYVFTCSMPAHNHHEIQQLHFSKCPFIHSSVMFRKAFILQAGGYNTHAYTFEDHVLWSRVVRIGITCNLQQPLIQVRLNPGSVCIDEKWRTKRFHEIKYKAIREGDITEAEGKELQLILKKQDTPKIKEGSYYSLLGKKYTWDNHQPQKARSYLGKAIRIYPGRIESYLVMALSFFPRGFINWMYKKMPGKV
ncbi:MAG TPA: glycosyltransferase [Ferruginibacter sp.]|nr:glycosyltransferase [Ferruginibacter sp.]